MDDRQQRNILMEFQLLQTSRLNRLIAIYEEIKNYDIKSINETP